MRPACGPTTSSPWVAASPRIASRPPRACTSAWRALACPPTWRPCCRCAVTGAASSWSPSRTRPSPTWAPPTPPTTVPSTTRAAPPRTSATCSALTPADVTAVWAGLRPLLAAHDATARGQRTAGLSRRHTVTDSGDGVVHVTGGKWTTYRQMAEDTVDALGPYLGTLARSRTADLRLHGVGTWRPSAERETHLYRRYGEDAARVGALIDADATLGEAPIDGLAYLGAEFVFAAREEMATTLIDLLARRTRAHLEDARATLAAAPRVADLVAGGLAWTREECARQVREYGELVRGEFETAGLAL